MSIDFCRVWRFLRIFVKFVYFSADRGTEPMGSEFSLAIGCGVRERRRKASSLEPKGFPGTFEKTFFLEY